MLKHGDTAANHAGPARHQCRANVCRMAHAGNPKRSQSAQNQKCGPYLRRRFVEGLNHRNHRSFPRSSSSKNSASIPTHNHPTQRRIASILVTHAPSSSPVRHSPTPSAAPAATLRSRQRPINQPAQHIVLRVGRVPLDHLQLERIQQRPWHTAIHRRNRRRAHAAVHVQLDRR